MITDKYAHEVGFWRMRFREDKGAFKNKHYKQLMLGMANEENDNFLKGKVVVDFGCGPRGSLAWTQAPSVRLGVDVLVDYYMAFFGPAMLNHGMIYVKSTENYIPIPSESVDVVISMNSMDHVENLDAMAAECLRILKPGGSFIGSFNLNEPSSPTEPLTLNEDILNRLIVSKLNVSFSRKEKKGPIPGVVVKDEPPHGTYDYFYTEGSNPGPDDVQIWWLRGEKL